MGNCGSGAKHKGSYIFAGRYKIPDINDRLGSGSFGRVFSGIDIETGKLLAIKIEKNSRRHHSSLAAEAKLYEELPATLGKPEMYYYNQEAGYQVLVLEMLGPSLEDVFELCTMYASKEAKRFTLRTLCVVGIRCLEVVRDLHEAGFIHRDIKPANFVFSTDPQNNRLSLVDFGLTKRYRDATTGVHIAQEVSTGSGPRLTGTPRFASINSHLGITLSRRDDIESIVYMLLYLGKGRLPWWDTDAKNAEQGYNIIKTKKQQTSPTLLCEGLPREFERMLRYARDLDFDAQPDYNMLIQLFLDVLSTTGHGANRFDSRRGVAGIAELQCDWNNWSKDGDDEDSAADTLSTRTDVERLQASDKVDEDKKARTRRLRSRDERKGVELS